MSLVIRLSRTGRKNRPSYRVGVFDTHTRRDGPPVEALGWYDPLAKDATKSAVVDAERVAHWWSMGASVTDTVKSILLRAGQVLPPRRTTRARKAAKSARRASAAKR